MRVMGERGAAPLVLRFSDRAAACVAASLWVPAHAGHICSSLHALMESSPHPVWIAGFHPERLHAWGERATALTYVARRHGFWGDLPLSWAAARPRAAPAASWAESGCPVCLGDYDDNLPAPTGVSRAPPERWHCAHTVCRDCDAIIQNGVNPKCPLCRADRRVFMRP